jgi:hypothetical protein
MYFKKIATRGGLCSYLSKPVCPAELLFRARAHSDGLFARRVNLFSALTSEIRQARNTGEIRHFTTLLNSGDSSTLLPGTRHARVKSAGVHV